MGALLAGGLPGLLNQSSAQVIDGSLKWRRLVGGGTAAGYPYLTRTPGSAGNRKTWTVSFWVKRCHLGGADDDEKQKVIIATTGTSNSDYFSIVFSGFSGETLDVTQYTQNTLRTNRVFRDPNAWMHILVSYDVDNATASDRAKLYINGVRETSFSTSNISSMSGDYGYNRAAAHYIGLNANVLDRQYFDGHLSQFYSIDGQALGPGYFGFTDPLTGTWRPKRLREGDSSINDGTVWSDGTITGTSGGSSVTISNPEYAFNADLSNGASFTHVANQESIITWTPPGGSFSGKNFRIYCYQPQGTSGANMYLSINGGSYVIDSGNWATVGANSNGWSTSQTIPAGTLTSISLKLTYGGVSTQSILAIEIDGEILTDSASYAAFGTNGFYLPFDGNSPIGEDKSGNGNNWTPVNFGGSNTIEKATGALPILNTDGGGKTASVGVRTDAYASSLVLALPLVGIATDVSNQINNGSSTKAITNGGATASSANSNFYGGSFYFDNNINQYLSASSTDFNFGSNPFTVEFWFKHNETSSWNSVYFTQGDVASGVSLYQSGDDIYVRWGSNPSYGYFDFTPSNDKWYHFALVREGTGSGETKVYIDGISQTTWVVGPPTMTSISSNDIYIGKFTDNTGYENYGYMQDFRVYKGIAKYTSNFVPASTNPDILPDTPSGVSGSSNLTKVTDGAVSFNGTSDYLDIADSADFDMGTGDFTLECFVNSIDNSDYQGVFGSGDYDDAAVILQISNAGLLRFTQSSGTLDVSGTTDLQNTGWHHIVMCRSGTTLRGFVDGRQEISTTYSSSIDWGHSNNSIVIGKVDKTDYPTQFYYKGHISNLRLVKGTALYTSNFTPPTSPLTNVTNTKLLCCKSPNLAGSATVTPGSITANGNAAASSFNPFNTDIKTVRGQETGYATLNPLDNFNTLSNGNLDVLGSTSNWRGTRGTIGMSSGKWYFEVKLNVANAVATQCLIGIAKQQAVISTIYASDNAYGWEMYSNNGNKYNVQNQGSYGESFTLGDVIGIAFDADNGTLTFYKNGISQGVAFTGLTAGPYYASTSVYGVMSLSTNFGQKPFKFPPPAGFQPLNDANIRPETVITRPDHYVGVKLYTGTTQSPRTISLPITPDLIWVKNRDTAKGHFLLDTVRGDNNNIRTDDAYNESAVNSSSHGILSTIGNNSFSVKDGSSTGDNVGSTGTDDYVAWFWKAGGNKNTFNVDDVGYSSAAAAGLTGGNITPTGASVGTKQGFSIIKYAGNLSSAGPQTVPHGLSQKPSLIISKSLNVANGESGNWYVNHSYNYGNWFRLNLTNAGQSISGSGGGTTSDPTNTLFNTYYVDGSNVDSNNYIAYLWHDVPGLQKFGTYVGNGDPDGPFIELGFRPAVVLRKSTGGGSGYDWVIIDSARDPDNIANNKLYPQSTGAENVNSDNSDSGDNSAIDILSNGFKVRASNGRMNANGTTFIYAAWAEAPTFNLYGGQSNAR